MGAEFYSLGSVDQEIFYPGACEWREAQFSQFADQD